MSCKCGSEDFSEVTLHLGVYKKCNKCGLLSKIKAIDTLSKDLARVLEDECLTALLIEKVRSSPVIMKQLSELGNKSEKSIESMFDSYVDKKVKQHNKDFNDWAKG